MNNDKEEWDKKDEMKQTTLRAFIEEYEYLSSRRKFHQSMADVLHVIVEEAREYEKVKKDKSQKTLVRGEEVIRNEQRS